MTHTAKQPFRYATSFVIWLIEEALWFPASSWYRSLKLVALYAPLFALVAVLTVGGWSNLFGVAVGGIIFGWYAAQPEGQWHRTVLYSLVVTGAVMALMDILSASTHDKVAFGLIFAFVGALMGWNDYQQTKPRRQFDLDADTRAADDLDGQAPHAPPLSI